MKALLAVVAALIAAGSASAGEPPPPLRVEATLTPTIALFGDDVQARVDFVPWTVVGRPTRTQRDAGSTTLVRTTFVLRCLTSPCVPPRDTAPLRFTQAVLSYREGAQRRTILVDWPLLVMHSRLTSVDADRGPGAATPWRADILTLPAVSYRVPPGVALVLLLVLAAVLALAGGALTYRAVPARAPAPEPEPEPEPEISPLERALALLEGRLPLNGAAEQRRALELVAEEVAARDAELARRARVLAWSEETPAVEETSGIAARARSELGLEEVNGDVPA